MRNKSALLLFFVLFSGCALTLKTTENKVPSKPVSCIAKYTEIPVIVDGNLDDPIWKITPIYMLSISRGEEIKGKSLQEKGIFQIAWDEKYLYIGAKFYDSDIVQESNKNQEHHYQTGDLIEIFLKPENSTWYWEIYGTPNEKKTIFWFPGGGRLLPGCFEQQMNLDEILLSAKIEGTLNNWKDKDDCWILEMAIPVKELTKYGDSIGLYSHWRILIGRYNHTRYLLKRELSMFPQLSLTDFRLFEEYGKIVFEK